jgi:outer membrane protein
MRKIIIALMAVLMTAGIASAQNYMVVDSEKVFKSITEYNDALEQIEKLATQYQKEVDASLPMWKRCITAICSSAHRSL